MADKKPVDINSLFVVEADSIRIGGLNAMLKFGTFHPLNTKSVREGIELADDLRSDKGTILYPVGTELSWERINRLLKFRESNPEMNFNMQVKASPKLMDNLRKELKDRYKNLFISRQKAVQFKKLMRNLTPRFDETVEKVLENDDLALELYRMRFVCDFVESQRAMFFADHAVNAGIFAAAIACTQQFEQNLKNHPEMLTKFMTAGFLHNWGAVMGSDRINTAQPEERQKIYWDEIQKNIQNLQKYELGDDTYQAYRNMCGWQKAERDFVKQDGNGGLLSNVLVVVEMFLRREDGLFGESSSTRDIIDYLNVQVMQKQLNDKVVNALTLGLELTDIFDFYAELDRLVKKCPYDSAVAYPLTGLYSPTIFVCKKKVTKCPFLELSVRAVNLVQRLGELGIGEYHRCKLLTPKLNSFYDDHYDDIKRAVGGGKEEEEGKDKKAAEGEEESGDQATAEGDAQKTAEAKPAEKAEESDK